MTAKISSISVGQWQLVSWQLGRTPRGILRGEHRFPKTERVEFPALAAGLDPGGRTATVLGPQYLNSESAFRQQQPPDTGRLVKYTAFHGLATDGDSFDGARSLALKPRSVIVFSITADATRLPSAVIVAFFASNETDADFTPGTAFRAVAMDCANRRSASPRLQTAALLRSRSLRRRLERPLPCRPVAYSRRAT